MSERKGILTGMKEIADYTGLSEPTIYALIRDYGFPARRTTGENSGGVWISNTDMIDKWSSVFSTTQGVSPKGSDAPS